MAMVQQWRPMATNGDSSGGGDGGNHSGKAAWGVETTVVKVGKDCGNCVAATVIERTAVTATALALAEALAVEAAATAAALVSMIVAATTVTEEVLTMRVDIGDGNGGDVGGGTSGNTCDTGEADGGGMEEWVGAGGLATPAVNSVNSDDRKILDRRARATARLK